VEGLPFKRDRRHHARRGVVLHDTRRDLRPVSTTRQAENDLSLPDQIAQRRLQLITQIPHSLIR
jgi:hypothetical protein